MNVRGEGRQPPFEVQFAVCAWIAAIAAFDLLGVLVIFNMATGQTAEEPPSPSGSFCSSDGSCCCYLSWQSASYSPSGTATAISATI